MRFYLASTSPARLATLRAAGIEPITIAPDVDEQAVAADEQRRVGPLSPEQMVQLLARRKAEAVLTTSPAGAQDTIDGLVVGGDSVFVLDGETYGKPHQPEIARKRWQQQRGRTGELWSGHWIIDHRGGIPRRGVGKAAVATVTFAEPDNDEIDAYIISGEPLRVAGAFTVDGRGGAFIRSVTGDPSTVVGLSLSTLRELVRELGCSWPALWNS